MSMGQGSVGRITQLPIRLVDDFRQDFEMCISDNVIDFTEKARLKRKLDVLNEVTEAVDDRIDAGMNLFRATTDTANTERKLAKIGYPVVRVRRARSGKMYRERMPGETQTA